MTIDPALWRRSVLVALLTVPITLALLPPPSQTQAQGSQCSLNSECLDPLVCRWGYCRQECAENRDCPTGLNLVCRKARVGGREYGHCVADAPQGTPCVNAGDCTSRRCTAGTCR